jgi:hypothetical protein
VAGPEGGEAAGETTDEVIHDGEVMGGEVPDDVDIMLEESEVDADAVDEVEISEFTLLEEFLHFPHGAAEEERVIDHEDAAGLFGGVDHGFGIGDVGSERFFDEDVFSGGESGECEWGMGADGSGDGDGIDFGISEEFIGGIAAADSWIAGKDFVESFGVAVADGNESSGGAVVEVPDEVGSPVTGADDSDVYSFHGVRSNLWPQVAADAARALGLVVRIS